LSSAGSSVIGFLQSGTGASATTVQAKLREFVSVKDFGAVGDGVADDTIAIQAARDHIAATKQGLVFPSGEYLYTVSPNWGITDAEIIAEGQVILKYTGTGHGLIFDAGASTSLVFGLRFTGNFILDSNASANDGIYVRSIHHSKIQARVKGCGTTKSGLRVEFAVCTEFDIVVSVNRGFTTGAKPLNGIILTHRDVGENVSACIFNNPIIEGVTGDGIVLKNAIQNTFTGGTSEANAGIGLVCEAGSSFNSFSLISE
jgi:hypothetical protein